MRHVALVKDPAPILSKGLTLTGNLKETLACTEVVLRVAVNLSPPREKSETQDSPVNGAIQSRVYSHTFRQSTGPPMVHRFADLHGGSNKEDNEKLDGEEEDEGDDSVDDDGDGYYLWCTSTQH